MANPTLDRPAVNDGKTSQAWAKWFTSLWNNLFDGVTGALSFASLTLSGALSAASAAITGALSAATLLLSSTAPASPAANTLYAGSGQWVRFDKKTGGGASYDFTSMIDGRFAAIRFTLVGLRAAADSATLGIRISDDGGATWKAGATDYAYAGWITDSTGTGAFTNLADSSIGLADVLDNSSVDSVSATVELAEPSSTTHRKMFWWSLAASRTVTGSPRRAMGSGKYVSSNNAVTGVRFSFNAGATNIAEGTIIAEGLLNP